MGRQEKLIPVELDEAEDAAITAAAKADPDNPPLSDEQIDRMRPIWEFPEHVAALRRAGLMPPAPSQRLTVRVRLDPEVVARLKDGGRGWQERANAILREQLGLPET
jgi:uncharacterized protein (DUF4415 family)